ncbi:hypothetical protein D1AOALGA4SA_10474 [Olavius algarvensis Delta 1 endosymbiont]|nr:hypothetical protein D1AOALGA4SA_10474 [Olavius algarvensis Delta 1 endosymbiont]
MLSSWIVVTERKNLISLVINSNPKRDPLNSLARRIKR